MSDPDRLSLEELAALIQRRDSPVSVLYGAKGNGTVRVTDLVDFVSNLRPGIEDVEAELDGLLAGAGAERTTAVDMDDLLGRAVRRLLGRGRHRPTEVYEIPSMLLAGRAPRTSLPSRKD